MPTRLSPDCKPVTATGALAVPGVSVSNVTNWLPVVSAPAVLPAYAVGPPSAAPSNNAVPAPATTRTGPVKERFIEPPCMGRPGAEDAPRTSDGDRPGECVR